MAIVPCWLNVDRARSASEVVQLLTQCIQSFPPRAIEALRAMAALCDQTGSREHSHVLRDRGAAHIREALRDRARRLFTGREKSQYFASPRFRQRAIRIVHIAISAQTYES